MTAKDTRSPYIGQRLAELFAATEDWQQDANWSRPRPVLPGAGRQRRFGCSEGCVPGLQRPPGMPRLRAQRRGGSRERRRIRMRHYRDGAA